MKFFGRLFKKDEKARRIVVYYLGAIVEGSARANPLGTTAKVSLDRERQLRRKYRLGQEQTFVTDQIDGASVVFCWSGSAVEAINFMSAAAARSKLPDLIEFAAEDLVALDRGLTHFPR